MGLGELVEVGKNRLCDPLKFAQVMPHDYQKRRVDNLGVLCSSQKFNRSPAHARSCI